jgi:glycosyltransferase involved in cell wall biosynthesis
MRIVNIAESSATGTLAIAEICCNTMARKGHEVHFVYSMRSETPKDIEKRFEKGVGIHTVGMGFKDFPWSFIRLFSVVKDLEPDVVHLHSSFAGLVGRFVGLLDIRSRYYYSPHCISFMRKDIGVIKNRVFVLLERIANIKKATYLACSNSEALAIKQTLNVKDVFVLENAIDLSEFSKTAVRKKGKKEKYSIVTVGQIRPQKGPEEFAEIAKQFKFHNCEFLWIGDGDEQSRADLVASGVDVLGWLPKHEVIRILESSDLYISTARWEGMPVSIIEAMAANLPVVARDCSGNIDLIDNGKNGILFSSTNEAFRAVNEFLSKPEVFQDLALTAKKAIPERFSTGRFEKELISLYEI